MTWRNGPSRTETYPISGSARDCMQSPAMSASASLRNAAFASSSSRDSPHATNRVHHQSPLLRAQCLRHTPAYGTVCRVALPHRDDGLEPLTATTDRPKTSSSSSNRNPPSSSLQSQLTNAALFGDVDTCIYLLQSGSRADPKAASSMGLDLSGGVLKQLVRTCFKRKRGRKALEVVLALPNVNKRQFSVLMKECIDRGDVKQLDAVLEARAGVGYGADVYTHSARISTLGNAKRSVAALEQLHIAMQDEACAHTIELYNAAISACAKAGDFAGAMTVWGLVAEDAETTPDVVTYNAMIKLAGAMGKFEDVKRYFGMITEDGLVPTSWTYAAVFSASAACRTNDAGFLIGVFDSMEVQPNDFILSSFFTAMSHSRCSKKDIDVVFRLLERSRGQTAELNDVTYTAFMTFLARQDMPDRAIDIWDAARKDEIDLSPHFFSALFSACAKCGTTNRNQNNKSSKSGQMFSSSSEALSDMAFDAFDEISAWWIAQDPDRTPKHVVHDVRTAFNAFLHFLGVVDQHDVAQLIFESMKSQGPKPDVVTYNTMLNLLGSSKDVDAALDLYWEMARAGLAPTEKTFGSLLHAFASVGDTASAKTIFDSLGASGIAPNSILYTSFIHAAVSHGDDESLALAFDLADEMRRSGVPLTDVTYGCLLVACEKQGDVARAFRLYQQSLEERVTPSDQMHNILISVCTRCGKLDEALDLVKSMARKHSNIQQHAMNSLTRALSIESPGRAARMLSLMGAMGMQPSRQTRLEVIKQCALAGDVNQALAMFNSVELDGPAGSALIISLCAAQNLQDAVRVYDAMMAAAWRKMGRSNEEKKTTLTKRALEPSGPALASLAHAHAAAGLTSQAWKFYLQLRRKSQSLEDATLNNRKMFEALIEGQCRAKSLKKALVVFDDWKTASSSVVSRTTSRHLSLVGPSTETTTEPTRGTTGTTGTAGTAATKPPKTTPRLSYLALAFLEAEVRRHDEYAWRVYDILATMRAQKESKRQSELARPSKRSHHF